MARAVLITSSASSKPVITVSPTAVAPNIKARCEIDLSPGTSTLPLRAPQRRLCKGRGAGLFKGPLGFMEDSWDKHWRGW